MKSEIAPYSNKVVIIKLQRFLKTKKLAKLSILIFNLAPDKAWSHSVR